LSLHAFEEIGKLKANRDSLPSAVRTSHSVFETDGSDFHTKAETSIQFIAEGLAVTGLSSDSPTKAREGNNNSLRLVKTSPMWCNLPNL
jgi:hypothetical protein